MNNLFNLARGGLSVAQAALRVTGDNALNISFSETETLSDSSASMLSISLSCSIRPLREA